jgi:hypothetical protein
MLLPIRNMNLNNIESGKDDDNLLIGRAHAVSHDDDRIIELDEDDILDEEAEVAAEDEGDLDFEPEYDRDY